MSKRTFIRSTTDGPQYFPTLTPSVEIQPGQVVGVPESVGVPAGFEAAKKTDGKDVIILDHPGPDEPTGEWVGAEDTSVTYPLETVEPAEPSTEPVTPTV